MNVWHDRHLPTSEVCRTPRRLLTDQCFAGRLVEEEDVCRVTSAPGCFLALGVYGLKLTGFSKCLSPTGIHAGMFRHSSQFGAWGLAGKAHVGRSHHSRADGSRAELRSGAGPHPCPQMNLLGL